MVVLGLLVGLLGSCGFSKEQFDGSDAAPLPVTVGFAQEGQIQDESSGAIQVIVRLSRPAPEPITVDYALAGGTAVLDQDFTTASTAGTLSFETGISEMAIDLMISIDTVEEDDETIVFTLSNPSAGARLGTSQHTITINHALLPRVNFSLETSSEDEGSSLSLNLTLDSPPLVQSTATIALKQLTTAAEPFDFTMPTNLTVTFPVNSQSQTITIPIINDTIHEENETIVVEIATTTNVVIGTKRERTHTILDNDTAPTVQFMATSQAVTEGNTVVNVVVQLSAPSGRVVTVPVEFGGGSATENADYSYVAKQALVFMPNQNPALSETSKTVQIMILADTTDEEEQTVITSLVDAPTNATIGTPAIHTLTIIDDDLAPTVSFVTPNMTVGEGDEGTTTVTYTMELSAASERMISFGVAFSGTATIPMDYTTVPAPNTANTGTTITIAPGATTATLDFIIVGDTVSEGMNDETIIMTIGNPLVNVRAMGGNAALQRRINIDDFDP